MRMARVATLLGLGAGVAGAITIAACSGFSEVDATPDAAPTTDGGGEDAFIDGPPTIDAPIDVDASSTGCSDGTREGYLGAPHIAACDGLWDKRGLIAPVLSTCLRQAGNDGPNPRGTDCSAGDLCATGWHVCSDHTDVIRSHPTTDGLGPCELSNVTDGGLFYATAQASESGTQCIMGEPADGGPTNDVIGCGDLLTGAATATCAPLNALLSTEHLVSGWAVSGNSTERATVQHLVGMGGVLCCAD